MALVRGSRARFLRHDMRAGACSQAPGWGRGLLPRQVEGLVFGGGHACTPSRMSGGPLGRVREKHTVLLLDGLLGNLQHGSDGLGTGLQTIKE